MEKTIRNYIDEMVAGTANENVRGNETFDLLDLIKGSGNKMKFVGYKTSFDVCIPIWQNYMDYFKIVTKESDSYAVLLENKEEIIEFVEYINDSQEKIIEALERDQGLESLDGFKPTKVSIVLFDYSGEQLKVSFYVPSNEEYQYHIYIKEDMSFDACCIS